MIRGPSKARGIFWALFFTGALFACFSYIPLTELSQKLFVEATGRQQTWFFPQRMNNGVMLWALANGLVGFALFFLGLKLQAKPIGWDALGLDIQRGEIFRALLLALVVFFSFFGILFVVYTLFYRTPFVICRSEPFFVFWCQLKSCISHTLTPYHLWV